MRRARGLGRARSIALAVAQLTLLGSAAPHAARASGCCVSATAVGMGRLLSWERFAVGLQTSLVTTLGFHDGGGTFHRAGDGDADLQLRNDVWALVDLTHHLSLWADLPLVLGYRRAGALGGGFGGGVGDVQAGLRWDVVPVAGYAGRPGVALTIGATAPTGRTARDALLEGDPRGAGVTGRGAWVPALGLVVERAAERWFLRGAGALQLTIAPGDADAGVPRRADPGLVASLVVGGRVHDEVVLSGFARVAVTQAAGATGIDPALGLAVAVRAGDHVTLQASLESSLLVDGVARGAPGQLSAALGVRYGYF